MACAAAPAELPHARLGLSLAALDASPLDLFDDIVLPAEGPPVSWDPLTAEPIQPAPNLTRAEPLAPRAPEGGAETSAVPWGWVSGCEVSCAWGSRGILEDWGAPVTPSTCQLSRAPAAWRP